MFKIGLDFVNKLASVKSNRSLKSVFLSKTSGLATDVFERTNSDDLRFKLIKTKKKLQIQTLDSTPLYECFLNIGNIEQCVYSKDGAKLYKLVHKPDGSYTKTNFDKDGNIESVIKFAKDGGLLSKKVITFDSKADLNADLPKYVYHFTSVENYKAMQKSGVIKTGTDSHLARNGNSAVFLVDEDNLLKKWNNLSTGSRSSYLSRLLKFCDKQKSNKVVILKIPTEALNIDKLAFRNQDTVMCDFPMFDLPKKDTDDYFAFSRFLKKNTLVEGIDCSGIADDIYMPDRMRHLVDGQDIAELKDFMAFPLEVLYKDNIPCDLIEDAAVIDTFEIAGMSTYDLEAEYISKILVQDALKRINN